MAENKKITLHPVKDDGTLDLNTNLYPKTNNIVDENGNLIEVATKDELESGLNAKQDTLVSGENIKTINGKSLLGEGNIQLTKEDVGLNNVIDTGDSAIPIEGGTTKFTTGGAYIELNKKEDKSNKVTSLSDISTDVEYPSAKAVYDFINSTIKILSYADTMEILTSVIMPEGVEVENNNVTLPESVTIDNHNINL